MNQRPSDPELVGKRIQAVRATARLSQSAFASRIGVTPSALANWEQGRQRPSIEAAQQIVDEFDLTLDWLMLGREWTLKVGVMQKLEEALRKRAS